MKPGYSGVIFKDMRSQSEPAMQTTKSIRFLNTSADADEFDQGAPPTFLAGQNPRKVDQFEKMYKIAIRNSIFNPRTKREKEFVEKASTRFPFFKDLVMNVKGDISKTIGLDARNHPETKLTRMADAIVESHFLEDEKFNEFVRMYWKSDATLSGEPIEF